MKWPAFARIRDGHKRTHRLLCHRERQVAIDITEPITRERSTFKGRHPAVVDTRRPPCAIIAGVREPVWFYQHEFKWIHGMVGSVGTALWLREVLWKSIDGTRVLHEGQKGDGGMLIPAWHTDRSMCRALLRITSLSLGHMQDITDEEAMGEGTIETPQGWTWNDTVFRKTPSLAYLDAHAYRRVPVWIIGFDVLWVKAPTPPAGGTV